MLWTAGTTYYGAAVEDYTISYDEGKGDGSFVVLASGITDTNYLMTSIVTGTTYVLKVQARSEYGLSLASTELSALAAQGPAQPDAPTTTVNLSVV